MTRGSHPSLRVLSHGLLIAAACLMLYPLGWMLAASFKPADQIFSDLSLWPREFRLENYSFGWNAFSVSFGTFFLNSFVVAALAVIGNVMACSLAAFAFARLEFPLKRFWFALMLGSIMLPYHVTLIPKYVLFMNLGWINTVLPLVVPKFLAVDAFFIFLMVQFIRGLPRELDEAAVIDGCGPFQIYWRIILPLCLPAIATTAIFTFIWTWDDFFTPLVYLNDIESYTVPLGLRSFINSSGRSDWGSMFAMSTLSLVPVFLFFLAFQRYLIEGIATSGLKG